MVQAAAKLQQPTKAVKPIPSPVEVVRSQQPPPDTEEPVAPRRGRPRKPEDHASLRNAIRVLELVLQTGNLSMTAVMEEFQLSKPQSISGIATCVRRSANGAGLDSSAAYRIDLDHDGKVWVPTPKTAELLNALKAKLAKLQRSH